MICCFTVKSFLFMSLPTAGMVIGWVSTVINLFQSGILIKSNDLIEFIRTRTDFSIPTDVLNGASVGFSVLTALTLLDLITSVMLIIGVNKRNHLFLLPWLINNGFFLVIKLFFGIGIIFATLHQNNNSPGPGLILMVISILAFLCMIWNAIYSLFQSIRKTNEQEILDTARLVGNPRSSSYELFKNPA